MEEAAGRPFFPGKIKQKKHVVRENGRLDHSSRRVFDATVVLSCSYSRDYASRLAVNFYVSSCAVAASWAVGLPKALISQRINGSMSHTHCRLYCHHNEQNSKLHIFHSSEFSLMETAYLYTPIPVTNQG